MPPATAVSAPQRLPLGALLVLATIGFTAITTELLPSGLLPQISADLRVSEAVAGYLTAGYAAIIVVAVLPATMLLARVPRKTLLVALVLAFALSNVLVGLAPDFGSALAARFIGGLAHGILWSTMAPFIARIVPAHKVGQALAVVFAGNSLGLAIGTPVGTALGGFLGWRGSFFILAASGIILGLLALWLLPAVRQIPDAPRPSLRKATAQPGVKTVAIAWPLLLMAHFALFTYIAPFIQAARLPDYAIPLSLTVLGASGLVGIWIAGMTVDSRPRRSLLVTTAAIAASMFLLPFLGVTLPGAIVLMAVWGAGLGAVGIYNQSAILRAGRDFKDAANSLTVLTIQVGITIGALYGAAALTTVGPLLVPAAAAVPVAIAFVLVLRGRNHAYPPGSKELKASLPKSSPSEEAAAQP